MGEPIKFYTFSETYLKVEIDRLAKDIRESIELALVCEKVDAAVIERTLATVDDAFANHVDDYFVEEE